MSSLPSLAPAALVVDDVLLDRVVLAVALRQLGYRVTQAVEGEEALRRLDEGDFRVVCLDWNLPGLNGDQIAKRILARPNAPPIIAITADDSAEMRERCRRAGVAGQLAKGFEASELGALLAKVFPVDGAERASPKVGVASDNAARKLLMGRSQEQFAAEHRKLCLAIDEGRNDAALRSLHNIVSLAGMVGALSIHSAARNLETCLRLGDPIQAELGALKVSLGNFHPIIPNHLP